MQTSNTYFLVLDIETSKKMEYDSKLKKEMPVSVWLSYGVIKLYLNTGKEIKKLRFRTWEELKVFLNEINVRFTKKVICFVHNLSYEFDFIIKNISVPSKFLCNSNHKVISGELEMFPKIEFHCTYQLTVQALSKLGAQLNLPKLESDYRTIYPSDNVTEEEWIYCERDCDIVALEVKEELKEYSLLRYIPLTSTGKVRKDFKEFLKQYPTNFNWDIMPPENCYNALVKTFNGAITMVNPRFTKVLINQRVKSFDEKSKYPGAVLAYEYPYTIEKVETFEQEEYLKYKFWIGLVQIENISSKYEWGVLTQSKMEDYDIYSSEFFNGKLLNSKSITRYITNIDLEIINKVYNYGKITFLEFYKCENYSRLPQAFIELIKKYAVDKYNLGRQVKQLEHQGLDNTDAYIELERDYMKSKAKLNSIYGMMVQKLVSPVYTIDERYFWHETYPEYKRTDKHLNRNFLYGIYITAYSRLDLVNNIIENCPDTFVYCDTDSIKFIDTGREFKDLNPYIPKELNDLPHLKNFNRFEEEPDYEQFLTYGAKKYAFIRNGVFGYTVAGLPKHNSEIDSFDKFKLNTTFKNCKHAKRYIYENSYIDIDTYGEIIDEGQINSSNITKGGIAIFETDYNLSMTKEDLFYIERNSDRWERKNIQQNMSIKRLNE